MTKTYNIQYNHITGGTNKYSTEHLDMFFSKLEKVMDDSHVVQQSIVLTTDVPELVIDPVPADYDYAPKYKLFHDKN